MSAVHGAPATFKVQTASSQWAPGLQSSSVAQAVLHAVASHAYGLQAEVAPAGQAPDPSQPAAAVAIPSLQLGPMQVVELDG